MVDSKLADSHQSRALLTRRRFVATAASSLSVTAVGAIAKPYLSRAADRPVITHGIQSGDVSTDSGVVWARSDRPSRMHVEVATSESFNVIRSAVCVDALPESDFTTKALIVVIMGGVGNLLGALVAGLLLGIAETFVARLIDPGLTLAVNYALFLAVLLVFGAADSWLVLLTVPAALLTGLAFAAPVSALAAHVGQHRTV